MSTSAIPAPRIAPWLVWYAWQVLGHHKEVRAALQLGLLVEPSADAFTPPWDLCPTQMLAKKTPTSTPGDLFDEWFGRWGAFLSAPQEWHNYTRAAKARQNHPQWEAHFVIAPRRWLGLPSWEQRDYCFAHVVPMPGEFMLCVSLSDTQARESTIVHWQSIASPAAQQRTMWEKSKSDGTNTD